MRKRIRVAAGVVLTSIVLAMSAFAATYATNSEANIPSDTSIVQEVELTEKSEVETMVTFEMHDAPTVSSPSPRAVLMAEEHERIETYDIEQLNILLEECNSRMEAANTMAEAANALGYDESNPIITLAQEEYENAKSDYQYYTGLKETVEWDIRKQEYPVATKIWLYLTKSMGLTNESAAGIMGNLMAEVGGQTLNIQPGLYGHSDNSYYGICQWNTNYFPAVQGMNLDFQLEFLSSTIEEQFTSYGNLYKSGFTYAKFKQMNNEQDAALAFAKIYERCNSKHYSVRLSNATKAYNYFVD